MTKLTAKQETFAQHVASGKNSSEAYRLAYDAENMKASSVNVNACKTLSIAKIAQRVEELRKPVLDRVQMTLEVHLADLMLLRDSAAKRQQFSAAIAAEVARGKASGFYVERSEMLLGVRQIPTIKLIRRAEQDDSQSNVIEMRRTAA